MATEKVTLARVSHFTKDKEGNPLVSKKGKPYTRCLIDTTDGRTLSGFGNNTTSNWNEGMEVEIDVSTVEKNGNTYYNFNTPKAGAIDLSEVHSKLDQILTILNANSGSLDIPPEHPSDGSL